MLIESFWATLALHIHAAPSTLPQAQNSAVDGVQSWRLRAGGYTLTVLKWDSLRCCVEDGQQVYIMFVAVVNIHNWSNIWTCSMFSMKCPGLKTLGQCWWLLFHNDAFIHSRAFYVAVDGCSEMTICASHWCARLNLELYNFQALRVLATKWRGKSPRYVDEAFHFSK